MFNKIIKAVRPYACSFNADTLWNATVGDICKTPAARRCSRATRAALKLLDSSTQFKDAVLNVPASSTADIVRNLCSCVIQDNDLCTLSSRLCLAPAAYAKYCFERRGLPGPAIISDYQLTAIRRTEWADETEAEDAYQHFSSEGQLSGPASGYLPGLSTLFLFHALSLNPCCKLNGWFSREFRTHINDLAASHIAACARTTARRDLPFARDIVLGSVSDVMQLMNALDYAALWACSVRDGVRYDARTAQAELDSHQTAVFWRAAMAPGGWYPDAVGPATA